VLKTQRSEDPLSKSITMVWPPMLMGARYSTSPCSGVAVTTPVPAPSVLFVAAPAVPAPSVLFVAAPAVPVDFGAAALELVAFAGVFDAEDAALAGVAPSIPASARAVSKVATRSPTAPPPAPAPPAPPAFAAFIASSNPGGRGTLYFLCALMRALVPAPTVRPLYFGFGIRSTLKLRFSTCLAGVEGAARENVMRAKRRNDVS